MAVGCEMKKRTQAYTRHPPLASSDIRRASFLRSFSKYIKKYTCERRALLVASLSGTLRGAVRSKFQSHNKRLNLY